METALLVIALVLAAMVLVVAEVCTPMFGLLAALALGCLVAAVCVCYKTAGWLGILATTAAIIGFPAYVIAAVKIIPRTPLGRRLALKRKPDEPGGGTPEADDLQRFVGRTTTAETTLRPSGTIRVDEKRIVATAESGMIEKGEAVEIIRATGTNVVVRRVDPQNRKGGETAG